jgi:hypothetical protein
MTQTPQQPESLEKRVTKLEGDMSDMRSTAEALLQTALIHQRSLEVLGQRQVESDRRFEIMLAEFRQMKIESDARFDRMHNEITGLQTEIRRIIDRIFNQPNDDRPHE